MSTVEDWLRIAASNLKVAKMASNNNDLLDICAFQTYECAQKALKGYVVLHQKIVLKTEDLKEILAECVRIDSSFKTLESETIFLRPYGSYTEFPYDFVATQEDVKQAISMATKIFNFVEKKVTALPKNNLPLFEK